MNICKAYSDYLKKKNCSEKVLFFPEYLFISFCIILFILPFCECVFLQEDDDDNSPSDPTNIHLR